MPAAPAYFTPRSVIHVRTGIGTNLAYLPIDRSTNLMLHAKSSFTVTVSGIVLPANNVLITRAGGPSSHYQFTVQDESPNASRCHFGGSAGLGYPNSGPCSWNYAYGSTSPGLAISEDVTGINPQNAIGALFPWLNGWVYTIAFQFLGNAAPIFAGYTNSRVFPMSFTNEVPATGPMTYADFANPQLADIYGSGELTSMGTGGTATVVMDNCDCADVLSEPGADPWDEWVEFAVL